mgnify:CR=1 FL=1
MLISIIILVSLVTVVYIISKRKYDKITYPLDKKEYPLKKLIPIGLYIMDILDYKFMSNYDRRLLLKFTEIKGTKNSWHYLKIHWANRIVLFITGLVIIFIIGLATTVDMTYCFFGTCFLVAIIISGDRELESRLKKRHFSIRWDFPDFLNKLALLVNAGLTISKAWEKIVKENKKQSDFYKEAEIVITEITSGKSELKVYEDFSRRCRTIEVARFVSIIIQNLRKGNAELASILRVISNESWEMRKNTAKKLGEEASAKMVIPMMFMFVAIILIVSTPAVLSIIRM